MSVKALTVNELESQLGLAVRQWRIDAGYSQNELAARASLSRSAIQNLELGNGSRVASLIQVLRSLDRLDALDAFTPREGLSPMEQLAKQRREQRRTPLKSQRVGRAKEL